MPKISKPVDRWFPMPDDPLGGKILVHHLTPGETSDIFDQVLKHEVEYSKEGTEWRPVMRQVNDAKTDRLKTFCAAVIGWQNFFDEDDKPLECTDENKIKALRTIEGLGAFVNECRRQLSADIADEKKDQEKNLPSTANASQ